MQATVTVSHLPEGGWIELTHRAHDAGLPRCERPSEDGRHRCVLMLYGHRQHDLPCVVRPIPLDDTDPIIVVNVRRQAPPGALHEGEWARVRIA